MSEKNGKKEMEAGCTFLFLFFLLCVSILAGDNPARANPRKENEWDGEAQEGWWLTKEVGDWKMETLNSEDSKRRGGPVTRTVTSHSNHNSGEISVHQSMIDKICVWLTQHKRTESGDRIDWIYQHNLLDQQQNYQERAW